VRMPRMDGVEATRQIRTRLPATQVIILTTFDDDEYVFEGLRTHIVTRDAATPATVTRYTMHPAGAIYGSGHGMARLPNQTPIRNLYLVGASATPGAGVEAVVLSGIAVAHAVCPARFARRITMMAPRRPTETLVPEPA